MPDIGQKQHRCTLQTSEQSLTSASPSERLVGQEEQMKVVYLATCPDYGLECVGETQQPLGCHVHQHTRPVAGRANSALLDHMVNMRHHLNI